MCLKIEQIKRNIELNISLGVNENGEQEFLDLTKAYNVLVAGRTGSGKSIFLHKTIKYLIENYSKESTSLFLIDLKKRSLSTIKTSKRRGTVMILKTWQAG